VSGDSTSEEAVRVIADLVMAAQGHGRKSLRECVADVYFDLTGEQPDEDTFDMLGIS
jgi:hypothetical protein